MLLFLHQLHYWSFSQYGVVIDDVRWIYKPIREWLSEVFTFLTEWKLRKAIASLLEKGLIEQKKLYVKHHEIKHDNPYWHPKNQTYYYSVNYDELQKRIEQVEGTKRGSTEIHVKSCHISLKPLIYNGFKIRLSHRLFMSDKSD